MSSFNENGHSASVATVTDERLASLMNAQIEHLLPKDLSSNKRAVIERLIELHQQNAEKR